MDIDPRVPNGNTRFSRYRSVRKAASKEQQLLVEPLPTVPQDLHTKQTQHLANRTPSRYHRVNKQKVDDAPLPLSATKAPSRYRQAAQQQKLSSTTENELTATPPPQYRTLVEDWPKTFQDVNTPRKQGHKPTITAAQNAHLQSDRQSSRIVASATRQRSKTASSPQTRRPEVRRSYDAAREEARLILEGEYDRLAKLKRQQGLAEKERRAKGEARAEHDRTERVMQQQTLESVEPVSHERKIVQRTRKWTIGGQDNHNSAENRGRKESAHSRETPSSPPHPPTPHAATDAVASDASQTPPVSDNTCAKLRKFSTSRTKERRPMVCGTSPSQILASTAWQPRAGDALPKTAVNGPTIVDAPISAVNAGERRVEIRFAKSKISLPVTPATTVKDLLNSASVIMSQPIDPRTAVLLETYGPLGLERPLRRYEHIRDIMNSWDSDTQNYLVILPQSECAATGLEQSDAPSAQPLHTMLQLYHSRRPGKWEKHWMYLKSDGQVTASNKENDGNAANVFHLSDFDVYMPTRKEVKRLRPPKKICFAIKSQQRSIMFESTENFVHFFATNEKAAADQWYNAVQSWRSWYLTNILEQTTTGKAPLKDALAAAGAVTTTTQPRPSTSHSRDSVPYQLGTFKPLMDFDAGAFVYGEEQQKTVNRPNSAAGQQIKRSLSLTNHSRKPSGISRSTTVKKQNPPTSFPGHKPKQASQSKEPAISTALSTDAAFTGGGLLGRAYSVRKAQAEEATAFMEDTNNAFMPNGLLTKQRSVRKVVKDDSNPGVILDTNEAFTGKGLISKKASTRTFDVDNVIDPGVIRDTNAGFTGGLLSVQRALTKKRSAASARPGEPLIDLKASSQFADHSLLRSVEGYEMATGQHLPAIDRSRGIEIIDKVGEAQ